MKKIYTLKENRDFRRLYSRGKRCAGTFVVVYAMKNRLGTNRLGLTAGKAVGAAVRRNRAKRLMRESFRLNEARLKKGYDFVIVARSRTADEKCRRVAADMMYAMHKLELVEK